MYVHTTVLYCTKTYLLTNTVLTALETLSARTRKYNEIVIRNSNTNQNVLSNNE